MFCFAKNPHRRSCYALSSCRNDPSRETLSLENCCNFSLGVDCCNSLISRPALSLWTRGSQCRRETSISRLLHCCCYYYTACYSFYTGCYNNCCYNCYYNSCCYTSCYNCCYYTRHYYNCYYYMYRTYWLLQLLQLYRLLQHCSGATSTAGLTTIAFAATIDTIGAPL